MPLPPPPPPKQLQSRFNLATPSRHPSHRPRQPLPPSPALPPLLMVAVGRTSFRREAPPHAPGTGARALSASREVCRDGVQGWCAGMVCRDGVQGGCAGMVCRDGVQGWCAGSVCRIRVQDPCAGFVHGYEDRHLAQCWAAAPAREAAPALSVSLGPAYPQQPTSFQRDLPNRGGIRRGIHCDWSWLRLASPPHSPVCQVPIEILLPPPIQIPSHARRQRIRAATRVCL